MSDATTTTADPRWGQHGREAKAEAILFTLQDVCGGDWANGTWLDVGCGSGGVAATLARRVQRMIGVDPEPWERWSGFGETHSNLTFRVGSYRDLDKILGNGTVDVVVCNQVYEHVDDPIALLAAIHAVLRPGGICYFAGPNLLWPIEPHVFWPFVHWLPRRFAQNMMTMLGSRHAKELDAWSWSYWKLTRAFRRAGFAAVGAIRSRIRAQLRVDSRWPVRLAGQVPRGVVSLLTPFAPAFVFILSKQGPADHA